MTHRIEPSQQTHVTQDRCREDHAWEDRIQDAIDAQSGGLVDDHEQQLLAEHLQNCAPCRELHRRLSAADTELHAVFRDSAKLSPDFDARLFAKITAATQDSLLAKRQREERDYRTRLAQMQSRWRAGWRIKLGNLVGIVATLVTLIVFFGWHVHVSSFGIAQYQLGWLNEWRDTLNDLLPLNDRFIRLPALAMLGAALVAALTLWLTKRGDRQLR